MRHFSALTRRPCSKVIRVDHGAVKTPAGGVQDNTSAVCTATDNQQIKLSCAILQLLHVLVARLHLEVVLDLLIPREAVEGLGIELSAEDLFDKIICASLGFGCVQT